ncbi:hypothetical protein AGABI2DRAFT_78683, partial [Agaricus bisporus var. bisporus H97]|uniref:hypothetical protein n=1 Tax=Agaricus bisporus var. bisporus (strain H97 / ATCC MYA-4626 / FGSC 10389) TaxID=936046 RepID=UPI00029F676D
HRIFKIPRYFDWAVIVNGEECLEDMRKATDDKLSFMDSLNLVSRLLYTVSPNLQADLFHIDVVRGRMSRNISTRMLDVLDEIDQVLSGFFVNEADQDWVDLTCFSSVVYLVSRVSARFLVGPDLSSNRKYTDIMVSYTEHIGKGAIIIRFFPKWLKPYVLRLGFSLKLMREMENYLRPLIPESLENGGMDPASNNDMVTWLWNAAPENHRTLHDLASRMIFIHFASISTTSELLSHVLFSLASYTSYIKPLREEISTIVEAEGWTKSAFDKMRKLDSFIKETQRVHGCSAAGEGRLTMSDYRFSDGTFIPKGTQIAVAERAINQDARVYNNPLKFEGFRFADMEPLKWQMTALNEKYMTFGIGRHACPGRFFAIVHIKAVVSRILLNYDIKLTDEVSGRPKDLWFTGIFSAPNKDAKISLKKRNL